MRIAEQEDQQAHKLLLPGPAYKRTSEVKLMRSAFTASCWSGDQQRRSQNRDDNLGMVTIQITDLITQVYNISYANVRRRN